MANQTPRQANSNQTTPPSTSSQSNVAFTPRSTSFADDSDVEFDPTPLQSPRGGPDYDDLPPSYDEAQHQAVSDARNGIAPLDPNQLEAHRLTLNEGPNEPEIWEYRIRGEQLNHAEEHEEAPAYRNFTNEFGTTVPVQHVQSSENIPVGRTGSENSAVPTDANVIARLLEQALSFTRHEPDGDILYAPRLTRPIAIPQQGLPGSSSGPVLRAYAKALHAHSIRPAEFTEFLDGLTAVCDASGATLGDLTVPSNGEGPSSSVQNYIRGANEAFFAPRGLRVSVKSFTALTEALNIPIERGQRAGAIASVLDHTLSPERRAQAQHPWIEALDINVPEPSSQSIMLSQHASRIREQREQRNGTKNTVPQVSREAEHDDPPHSIPEPPTQHEQSHDPRGEPHGRHRRGRRGWGGPRGRGHGPFPPGFGPFGPAGFGPFGPPGFGPRGPFGRGDDHRGRGRGGSRYGPPTHPNENWAAWGSNLGKWGEEFGKRMGDWGQQLGKQAEAFSQDMNQRAEFWNRSTSGGSGSRGGRWAGRAPAAQDDLPPGYGDGGYDHSHGQETGVVKENNKSSSTGTAAPPGYTGPPGYNDYSPEKRSSKHAKHNDDASSVSSSSSDSDSDSSLSSDSDSDSDSSDDDIPNTHSTFLKRIHTINQIADSALRKGKKTPQEIYLERATAIEAAQAEKAAADLKYEHKLSKRAVRREWKQKQRDLKREHRHRRRELRAAYVGKGKGKDKAKGKAKRSPEWKEARREYRATKKELRREKKRARKEWNEGKRGGGGSGGSRGLEDGVKAEQKEIMDKMAWVVIENLRD